VERASQLAGRATVVGGTRPSRVRSGAARSIARTAWAPRAAPLREFLRTETAGALVLLAATIAALAWANAEFASYESFWTTELAIRVGETGIAQDLRGWINNGLMAFFFLVAGLEARREFDVGDLRERRRIALPVLAALGYMAVPVLIYLAFNVGEATASGWGVAMATDTAFALGVLALVGGRCSQRLRVFMLSVVIVDDVIALVVIAAVYAEDVDAAPLAIAVALFAAGLALRSLGVRRGRVYAVLGGGMWVAAFESGIKPVIVGIAMGLIMYAHPAGRQQLERATTLVHSFREQPTPRSARSAQAGLKSALSPNERMQQLWHPWTSFVIVPLFALANAGLEVRAELLRAAFTSPVTLGILVGYVVGKPVGMLAATWLGTRRRLSRLRPPVPWAELAGGGVVAGTGFTVSLLIASLAFEDGLLEEAKVGILAAAALAALLGWLLFRIVELLPPTWRIREDARTAEPLVDLAFPVDPRGDHVRGRDDAAVTVVEYGDFACAHCRRAHEIVRELLAESDELRFVYRHLPLVDVHEHAQLAAEAAEAAGAQGAFWEMHDLLFAHQGRLETTDLVRYARELGLDVDRFTDELERQVYAARIAEDVRGADLSGVAGTPTFFVNGRRHRGPYDPATLTALLRAALEGGGRAGTRPGAIHGPVDRDRR
jgi:Na+/H+ antiporter NhaA